MRRSLTLLVALVALAGPVVANDAETCLSAAEDVKLNDPSKSEDVASAGKDDDAGAAIFDPHTDGKAACARAMRTANGPMLKRIMEASALLSKGADEQADVRSKARLDRVLENLQANPD